MKPDNPDHNPGQTHTVLFLWLYQHSPSLPHKWQGPKNLSHSLLPFCVHISRKSEQIQYSNVECIHPKRPLNYYAKFPFGRILYFFNFICATSFNYFIYIDLGKVALTPPFSLPPNPPLPKIPTLNFYNEQFSIYFMIVQLALP